MSPLPGRRAHRGSRRDARHSIRRRVRQTVRPLIGIGDSLYLELEPKAVRQPGRLILPASSEFELTWAGHGFWGCHQGSFAGRHDGGGPAYCCRRQREGGNPADDCPAGGKVQEADPWPTVMIQEQGNDRRRHVDAEHEAQDEVETDQNADAISKAFHFNSPVCSLRRIRGQATRGRELGLAQKPLPDGV